MFFNSLNQKTQFGTGVEVPGTLHHPSRRRRQLRRMAVSVNRYIMCPRGRGRSGKRLYLQVPVPLTRRPATGAAARGGRGSPVLLDSYASLAPAGHPGWHALASQALPRGPTAPPNVLAPAPQAPGWHSSVRRARPRSAGPPGHPELRPLVGGDGAPACRGGSELRGRPRGWLGTSLQGPAWLLPAARPRWRRHRLRAIFGEPGGAERPARKIRAADAADPISTA
jgi:hypothetical protein